MFLIPGKDFIPANTHRREDVSMKSPPSSLANILTPPQQCTAHAKLCLDSAEVSQPIDALPTVRAPVHSSARSYQDIHGKNLFGGPAAGNNHQCIEQPLLSPAGKVVTESAVLNNQVRTDVKCRPNRVLEAPCRNFLQNCDDRKGHEDSRGRKHPHCKPVDQPCGFWDWLSPSKRKDASGNTHGQEGYDPSTMLIPKQYYDEMTGYAISLFYSFHSLPLSFCFPSFPPFFPPLHLASLLTVLIPSCQRVFLSCQQLPPPTCTSIYCFLLFHHPQSFLYKYR
jgi:hypothetical protein